MKHPRNPTRRSRNIGTEKQGHGIDNELTIPSSWADSRVYYERLVDAREYVFELHGERKVVLVEPPADGHFYGCTPNDVERLLGLLPEIDVQGLDLLLFRQPTKKQRILSSVWGRFLYYACPGRHSGSAICFESQNFEPLHWSKSVDPETARELKRLEEDGHKLVKKQRSIAVCVTAESLRNTILYRTALHEVGHYVDWVRSVLDVDGTPEEEQAASRAFDTKTNAMKEDSAHRYAREVGDSLRSAGELPFERMWSDEAMSNADIEIDWFV